MAIGVIKNESTLALVEETTEGTYVAPSSGTDYLDVLSEGMEFNKARETIERDLLNSTIEVEAARVGIPDVTGAVPVEYKASTTEGEAPQSMDLLLKSLLGGKRQVTANYTSDTGHSATQINMSGGEEANFAVGDIVLVKQAGAYECRPISAIGTGGGGGGLPEITDYQFADASGGAEADYDGTFLLFETPSTQYLFWYNLDGGSADPSGAFPGRTAIELPVNTGDSGATIASETKTNGFDLLTTLGEGTAIIASDTVTWTNATNGNVTDADAVTGNIDPVVTVTVTQQGASGGGGGSYIEFPFALDNGAPDDNVEIGKCTTYYHDTTQSVTMSAEHNIGNQGIMQKVSGLRAASMALENWTVGQTASATFGLNGLSLERADEDASFTPDTSADGLPPVMLSACLWLDGMKRPYTEFSLNVENELSPVNSACDPDGKIATRLTKQTVTYSANPYMDDTDLSSWDDFNDNEDISVFAYAYNPSATDGEFDEVVAVWIPQSKITAHPVADQDGVVTDALEGQAHKSAGNDTIFLGFI